MNYLDKIPEEIQVNIVKYCDIEDEINVYPDVIDLSRLNLIEILRYRFPYVYDYFLEHSILSEIDPGVYFELRNLYSIDLNTDVSTGYTINNIKNLLPSIMDAHFYPSKFLSKIIITCGYGHLLKYIELSNILKENIDKLFYDINYVLDPAFKYEHQYEHGSIIEKFYMDDFYDIFYEIFKEFLEGTTDLENSYLTISMMEKMYEQFPTRLIENNLAFYLLYLYLSTKSECVNFNSLNIYKGHRYDFSQDFNGIFYTI